ncbi:ABC transporter permease [Pseudothermotoga lettingae]|uniref:ABC-2 type transporter n=1 Tax=Pseudothermotoga lettingae (strain ATCC BAA-301 / DSM 14385 / NBRC 107922 / TMO) TaxID=416591 RepID=A8F4E6_PSELT|nr:ABC transporter permease [Pseudothermotoga lettingae]ABV33030.1 ABC-2 type transporter [Pseudothermotoga lettingae TMO]MDI3494190.1 type transport system permease protein [Pseudothermotoga sp.]GLI47968.1 ABC transporter permease [Pseudothermotoga lettingae TMO]
MIRLILTEVNRVFKNKLSFLIMFLVPIVVVFLTLIMFNSFSVLNTKIGILNLDDDPLSRFTVGTVMSLFRGGTISYVGPNYQSKLLSGEYSAIVIIPKDFSKNLYAAKQTTLSFIPSPVDLQVSTIVYRLFNSMFEDLQGSPFFDPQVMKYLFTSPGYPAPKLILPEKEKLMSFESLLTPIAIFLSAAFVIIAISCSSTTLDRQIKLTDMYMTYNLSGFLYIAAKVIAYSLIGMVESAIACLIFVSIGVYLPVGLLIFLTFMNSFFHASFGVMLSCITDNLQIASLLGVGTIIVSFFLSGMVVPISSMPEIVQTISKYSPLFSVNYVLRKSQIYDVVSAAELIKVALIAVTTFALVLLTGAFNFKRR